MHWCRAGTWIGLVWSKTSEVPICGAQTAGQLWKSSAQSGKASDGALRIKFAGCKLAPFGWKLWRSVCMMLNNARNVGLALAAGEPPCQCFEVTLLTWDWFFIVSSGVHICVCMYTFIIIYVRVCIYIPGIKPKMIQTPECELKQCWLSFLCLYICNLDIYLFSRINILSDRSMCCSAGQERDDSSDLHAISLALAY